MRAPTDTIPAPPFLTHLKWVNVPRVRLDKLRGEPVLIEFWDFRLPNSLRTLPYMKAWHERYAADGLHVIGIHSPGSAAARERDAVEAAVARLQVAYPVLLDPDLEMWEEYGNQGWPARYLFDGRGMLFDYHYGEGAYVETELAIQELLGVERKPLGPLGPADPCSVSPPPPPQSASAQPLIYRAMVGASSADSRFSSSRRSRGGPSSSTSTAPPGQ
jgi:thiol-disulfide isomerase/thioredoxin